MISKRSFWEGSFGVFSSVYLGWLAVRHDYDVYLGCISSHPQSS